MMTNTHDALVLRCTRRACPEQVRGPSDRASVRHTERRQGNFYVLSAASTEASSADRYDAVSSKSGTETWINCVEGSDLQRRAEAIR